MKAIIKNDKIIVFLNRNINDENSEEYFKSILLILNKRYNIEFNGYYNVDVYKDSKYGMVIELQEKDLDYYNYFNQVDIHVNALYNNGFLYNIKYEFIDDEIKNNTNIYIYNNKIYLKTINSINDNLLNHIVELSDIVYDSLVSDVLKYGEKVDVW